MARDTDGKPGNTGGDPRASSGLKLHQALAQGKPIQTGAGAGAKSGKEPAPSRW